MAQAQKKAKAKGSTPGRPKKTATQFWDIGKVGRKTGITLEDKGIRDEHGMEPVSHVFSSPVSPQRHGDRTLQSSDMNIQETSTMLTLPSPGSGPDVDMTLASRKTPRLPPPRASTPRHTNIGSPKRMSTGRPTSQRLSAGLEAGGSPARLRGQQPPNRVLDFSTDGVHKSIESPSPFKPRHALRRSTGGSHRNPFASASPVRDSKPTYTIPEGEEDAEDEAEAQQDAIDEQLILDGDDSYDALPQQEDEQAEAGAVQEPAAKRKPGRPRKSGDSINTSQVQSTPPVANTSSSKKRTRSSLVDEQAGEASVSQSRISEPEPANKKQRGGRRSKDAVVVHQDEGGDVGIDPSLIMNGEELAEHETAVMSEVPKKGKGKGKGKGKKAAAAPKERDPNRAMSVKLNDSPSKLRNKRDSSRGLSVGPISNVHLRASTPFEDANERTSRFGRALLQPLKYWANEMRIYKHGETAGIVRADEVEPAQRKKPKKKSRKSKAKNLDDIEEESETESTHPDEWEDEMGVIAGMVANWDPEQQVGVPEDLVREDLGFASSSIVTRDVAGSEFKYAKIMTLPFFGSGVVELPPNGFKRAKNSRKMQMCFFVHEGKVMVEVGAASTGETNQFAISRGGVWVVPRGNNYAITNESSTKTARIFFAQGCEVDALAQ